MLQHAVLQRMGTGPLAATSQSSAPMPLAFALIRGPNRPALASIPPAATMPNPLLLKAGSKLGSRLPTRTAGPVSQRGHGVVCEASSSAASSSSHQESSSLPLFARGTSPASPFLGHNRSVIQNLRAKNRLQRSSRASSLTMHAVAAPDRVLKVCAPGRGRTHRLTEGARHRF